MGPLGVGWKLFSNLAPIVVYTLNLQNSRFFRKSVSGTTNEQFRAVLTHVTFWPNFWVN